MLDSARPLVGGALCLCAAVAPAADAAGPYPLGFTWNRAADWTPGTAENFSWGAGNPNADAVGHRVWSMEWIDVAGDITSPQPWFEQPGTLMVWDADWFGFGGVWARANDLQPPIYQDSFVHDLRGDLYQHPSLVRWTNPAGDNVQVRCSGTLTVHWSGEFGLGLDVDVDVVIAKVSAGQTTTLASETIENPKPGEVGAEVELKIDLTDVPMNAGDSIAITARAREGSEFFYFIRSFDDLTITLTSLPTIPQPVCPGDLNGDGTVGAADLGMLLGFWGKCPRF